MFQLMIGNVLICCQIKKDNVKRILSGFYLFNSIAARITGATPFWSLFICFSEM